MSKKTIRSGFNVGNILIVTILALILLQVLGFILNGFGIQNSIKIGPIFFLFILGAVALAPIVIIKRMIFNQGMGTKDLVFLALIVLIVFAFLFIFPNLIPQVFSTAQLELMSLLTP